MKCVLAIRPMLGYEAEHLCSALSTSLVLLLRPMIVYAFQTVVLIIATMTNKDFGHIAIATPLQRNAIKQYQSSCGIAHHKVGRIEASHQLHVPQRRERDRRVVVGTDGTPHQLFTALPDRCML